MSSLPSRPRLVALLLALITAVVFWPVLHCEFVNFDDEDYITQNAQVQSGINWNGLRWAFATFHSFNWHPITWLSHMLDCQLFGINSSAHHGVNLLLHAANAMLLLLVLHRMTGYLWPSAFAAALFAIHPVHVESVAWASERKDVLSTFFLMLTLWAYARFVESKGETGGEQPGFPGPGPEPENPSSIRHRPPWLFFGLALLFFAMGLMSKPMLVTGPFVLLLLDFWPLRRPPFSQTPFRLAALWPLVREKIPFLMLSLASSVITCLAQRQAMPSLDYLPIGDRLGNALISCARYIGKMVWPANLAIPYPHPGSWPLGVLLAALALIGIISVLVIHQTRSRPYLLAGWCWFFGTLIPVIGLVQVGSQSLADRYTYIPLIGLFVMVSWGFKDLSVKLSLGRWVPALIGAILLLACAWRTRAQLAYWQNSETLFTHALAVTRYNLTAHFGLGKSLAEQGRNREALAQFEAALALKPDFAEAEGQIGLMLAGQGDLENAVAHYRRAIQSRPDSAGALNNLAWLFSTCPDARYRNGAEAVRLAEHACEVTHFQKAIFIGTLAAAYAEAGRFEEAIVAAQKAHDLALRWGEKAIAAKNLELMELYRKGQPFRDG